MRIGNFILFERKQTDADILEMLGGGSSTSSGIVVSSDVALRVPAVARAVTLISDTVASFPIIVERRAGNAWEPDTSHPVAKLLDAGPNDWTSSAEFVRDMIVAALTHDAGAMAWVNKVGGELREVIAYRPGIIAVEYDKDGTGEPSYRINGRPTPRDEIIHLRTGFARSPVMRAREAIGVALTMEKHAGQLFGKGARPGGVIETPKSLGHEGSMLMLKGWRTSMEGSDNAGKTAILWDGATWRQMTLSSVDAQFLELRKEQVVEIARAFGVPPAFLYELGRATWGNFEQQTKTFLSSLETWMQPFEASMRRALFSPEERPDWRISFERDDFSSVDLTARASAISSLIASRVISPNESRPWIGTGLAPYPGGDEFANPHTGASQPGKPSPENSGTPKPENEEDDDA